MNEMRIKLNKDQIKYIAMVTMLLNHISHMFLDQTTAVGIFCTDIGYFTAPVMCYFMVEGYQYTHSKIKYMGRLALFAVLSQIPFMMVFEMKAGSMMFTLLLCFLILYVRENMAYPALSNVVQFILIMLTLLSDWPIMAAVFIVFFARMREGEITLDQAFQKGILVFYVFQFTKINPEIGLVKSALLNLLAGIGPICSYLVIRYAYDGTRAKTARRFHQWFFYIFYPVHLLALVLLKRYVL